MNDGKIPPIKFDGKRVKVMMHRNFLCRILDGFAVHRATLEFEPAIFGYFSQVRLQLSTPKQETPGFGRQIKPVIDISRLKGWLDECEVKHGAKCHAPKWFGEQQQPDFLRVIDVKKNCVIAAPPDCRYVSLSYVWGDRKEMKSRLWLSTVANRDAFEKEGGLDIQALPRTIFDAIELVSMMGEHYLWVDALCIVQDDEVELA